MIADQQATIEELMFKGPVSFNLFSHDLFLRQSNTSSLNTDYLNTSPSPLKSKSILPKPLLGNSSKKKRQASIHKSSIKVKDLLLRQVNQSQIIEDLLKRGGSQPGIGQSVVKP